MNTGRTAKNPNADLLYGVARAYGCWRVAEVAAVFSGHNRLMQRPESVRTRRPAVATATELERKNSGARRKTGG